MAETSPARLLGLWASLTLSGCYDGRFAFSNPSESEGAPDDSLSDSGADPDPEAEALCDGAPLEVGASAMLRLTQEQYANALRDLLGMGPAAVELAKALPSDEKLGAFTFNTAGVPSMLADTALRNAEAAAEDFVERLAVQLPCSTSAADRACAQTLVDQLGPRAFRRPLEAQQRERLLALYDQGASEGFSEGIARVVTALLTSPWFLYRVELGDGAAAPGERFRLTAHEVATRLSLMLWNTIPDPALWQAAADGTLDTAAGRRAEAERMLADPRAQAAVMKFHKQWLGVDAVATIERDPELYPEFDDTLAQGMVDETAAFVRHVIFEDEGSFEALMTATYTVADDAILRLYGIEPDPDRDRAEPVELDPTERGGVLTRASFLAANAHRDQASPILRGISVRTNLLCQGLPPPPPDVDDLPPPSDPDATTRERFEQHTEDPACAACHELIDPIGFGFSNYDALGRFHELESGQPVDPSGQLVAADDASGPFTGAVELGQRLAHSTLAQRCYAEQWFVFANGRSMVPSDTCELDRAYTSFVESELDIRELVLAVVESPSFSHRVVADVTPE
ncbi:MAG: DUF1592 domain-containing protein [Myxococcota bacterium]